MKEYSTEIIRWSLGTRNMFVSCLLCSVRTSENIKQLPSDTEAEYYHILATPKHQVHH